MTNYERLQEINESLREEAVKSELTGDKLTDYLEDILHQEIDRLCIYTSDCWDICRETRAHDFYIEEIGEHATDIPTLAYWILRDIYNTNHCVSEIVESLNEENHA